MRDLTETEIQQLERFGAAANRIAEAIESGADVETQTAALDKYTASMREMPLSLMSEIFTAAKASLPNRAAVFKDLASVCKRMIADSRVPNNKETNQ